MSDLRAIVDTLIALAAMEAVVKPVVVRLTKKALKWADKYIHLVPNWLYHAPSSSDCPEDL